jgi:hypothetical protein
VIESDRFFFACTEIYGFVQDWIKCNTSDMFMPMSPSGVVRVFERLYKKAGVKKKNCNVHMCRHSAITHWVNIGLRPNAISLRAWESRIVRLSTYISLSDQIQATAYKNAKGLNEDSTKVINPIACRCVEFGKLIQSGNLCKSCKENSDLKIQVNQMKSFYDRELDHLRGMVEGMQGAKDIELEKIQDNNVREAMLNDGDVIHRRLLEKMKHTRKKNMNRKD